MLEMNDFKVGDRVKVMSDTMELIVPVTHPATYVELYEGDVGFITEILDDGITLSFNGVTCDFEFEEFESGFLELVKVPKLSLLDNMLQDPEFVKEFEKAEEELEREYEKK